MNGSMKYFVFHKNVYKKKLFFSKKDEKISIEF